MQKFVLQIVSIQNGWAEIKINNYSFFTFYIVDSLKQLIEKTVLLNSGINEIEITFLGEPEEYIIFIQEKDNCLKLKIYQINYLPKHDLKKLLKFEQANLLYETETTLKRFTNQILSSFEELKNRYGVRGYETKEGWGNEFPERRLLNLKNILKAK